MPAGEARRLTMKKVLYFAAVCSLVFSGCCAECRYYNSEPACQKAKLVCDKVAKEKGAQGSEMQKALETECESAQFGCRQVLIQKGLIKKPQP
jgi:hypothetical protein